MVKKVLIENCNVTDLRIFVTQKTNNMEDSKEQMPTKNMNFGWAIRMVQEGKLVAREGWNGKKMFIFLRPGDTIKTGDIEKIRSLPEAVKKWIDQNVDDKVNPGESGLTPIHFTPYFCMKAADNSIVNGWLASQTDMLAEDWTIVE